MEPKPTPPVAFHATGADIDPSDPYLATAARLTQEFAKDAIAGDQAGGRPDAQMARLKESGLLKLHIPKEYGGDGQPWSKVLRIVREFAKVDGSISHLFGYHFHWLSANYLKGSPEQAERFYRLSAENNWFWGNSSNSFSRNLVGRQQGKQYILNGRHPFSSGAHVADYLQVAWEDEETGRRCFAAIPATRTGITPLDDWDGIGQRQTGSGTVLFENVQVSGDELLVSNHRGPFSSISALVAQSVLLNVFLGSAQGALGEARVYTITQSRPWITSGFDKAVEDPWIKRVYGDLFIKVEAATLLANSALTGLDAAWARGWALTEEERGATAIVIAAANSYAGTIALEVTSTIFEVMGTRSATAAHGYDRFWRNVRIHTLHSPSEYKVRNVGNWFLTGQFPEPNVFQ
jgi:alkylation response protein AidB-like acyl-CoA dehydrogenase